MATVTARGIVWTTTTAAKTVASFTPAAGDLIVAVVGTTGSDTAPTISDNDSSITSWTLVDSFRSYGAAVTGGLRVYVSGQGASGSPMTVTMTSGGTDTGGGLAVFSVTGASAYGASAIRSSGGQADQAAGTPAPVLSNTPLTANAALVAVMTNTNGSANAAIRTGYTEHYDQGFNTPPSGLEVQSRASGETSATLTTGAVTPSGFAAIGIEIASNVTAVVLTERFRRRDDSVALNSTTFPEAGNIDWSQDVDTTFRVRWQVQETAGAIPAYTLTGQVECRLNGGAYQDVTTSSTICKAVASAQFNDGDATTDILAGGTGTFVAGSGSETGNAADVNLSSQHTELEFALQIVGADVVNADVVDLRLKGFTPGASTLASVTVVEAVAHSQPVNDSIAGTDAVANAATHPLTDAATVTDAIDTDLTLAGTDYEQPVDDSIVGTDAQAKATTHPVADAAAGTDATARAWTAARSQPDAIAGTDAQAKASTHPLADTAAATDARASSVGHALADPVAGTDAATRRVGSARADTIAGTDTRASASAKPLADTTTVTDVQARVWAAKLTIADGLSITDSVSTSAAGGHQRAVDDSISGTDAIARTTATVRMLADSAAGTDARAKQVTRPQADAVAATDARSRVWAAKLTVADGIAATDAIGTSSAGANERAVDDTATVTDAISVSLGSRRTLGDSITATDALATQADYVRQPADALTVADALARAWAIFEAQADGLTVTDAVNARIPPSQWDMDDEERWPPDTDEDWPADADSDWEAQTDDRWLVSAESRW